MPKVTKSKAEKKKDPLWDYLNAVTFNKDVSLLNDPLFEKSYNSFLINRALSYHEDSVLAANIMNECPALQRRDGYDYKHQVSLQFLFLLNTLRARRRYARWLKHTDSDDVKAVAEYYGTSIRHARSLVTLHSSEQFETIRRRLHTGGTTSKRQNHDSS